MSINAIPPISPSQNIMDIGSDSHILKPGYAAEAGANGLGVGAIGSDNASTHSFGKMLTDAIANVDKAQSHAGDMTTRFAAGEPMDVHQVMIASQEATVALNLAVQVRNKLVEGYTEIMHVNV